MSKLPILTGKALIKALKKAGFEEIRIKGSHHFLRHHDGRCTVVPVHSGETVGKGLLSQILKCRDLRNDPSTTVSYTGFYNGYFRHNMLQPQQMPSRTNIGSLRV